MMIILGSLLGDIVPGRFTNEALVFMDQVRFYSKSKGLRNALKWRNLVTDGGTCTG